MKKSFKGFTLVEVLIVIIIVGILIAALLPRLIGAQARARDVARGGAVNQVAQGVALVTADGGTITEGCASAAGLGSVLSSIPTDPQNTTPTVAALCATDGQLTVDDAGGTYVVYATVEIASNGNCTISADLTSVPTLSDTGTHTCVVVN